MLTSENYINILPIELKKQIFAELDLQELIDARVISKNFKKLIDDYVFSPTVMIKIIQSLNFPHGSEFLDLYRQRDAYKKIVEDFKKNIGLTSNELICYALATDDITTIDAVKLEKAVEKNRIINAEMKANLQITIAAIKLSKEIPNSNESRLIIEDLQNNLYKRQNTLPLNLQGADLSEVDFHKPNFIGAAITNVIFSREAMRREENRFDFLSPNSFNSRKNFTDEMTALLKQISTSQQKDLIEAQIASLIRFYSEHVFTVGKWSLPTENKSYYVKFAYDNLTTGAAREILQSTQKDLFMQIRLEQLNKKHLRKKEHREKTEKDLEKQEKKHPGRRRSI